MSNTESSPETNLSITSPSEEEMIDAVCSALHLREHWLSMNKPDSTIWRENKARLNALRAVLQRLEASRWRPADKIAQGLRDAALVTKVAGEALRNFPEGVVTRERFNEVICAIAPYVSSPPSTTSDGE